MKSKSVFLDSSIFLLFADGHVEVVAWMGTLHR